MLRDEAEERERVADGLFERRRVGSADGGWQPCTDCFERRRLDVARARRERDGGPVVNGMVGAELAGDRILHDRRLAVMGGFLLDVEQQVLVDCALCRGRRGEETLFAAVVEDGL